ncbi:MAG: cupin domain-containing protein [Promethearchaeota archaeon]
MIKSTNFNINETDWVKFEKNRAIGIYSKDLDLSGAIKNFTIKLMKVEPNGEFPPHIDNYSHLFYLISGIGEGLLRDEVYKMENGHVTFVKAGERHGYRNIGNKDMYLITMNIPEKERQ